MLAYAPNAIQYEAWGMYCHWPLNTMVQFIFRLEKRLELF